MGSHCRRGTQRLGKNTLWRCNAQPATSSPAAATSPTKARGRAVALGGPTPRIATYGELVTSIINPSHRVAQDERSNASDADAASPMTNYNAVMTVQQLIDLTQFLQDQYEIRQPDPTEYPEYFYP